MQPKNAQAWFNLGYLYDQTSRPPKAVDAFEQAVRLDPKLDPAWYGLGLALATLGRHAEAARALEEAARLQPMNGRAWYQLGMAYHTLHQEVKVKEIALHLNRFDRHMTRRLILDTGRTDLAHLIADFHG
jgi:tetratricopeptide (TPR) repeat protein